MGFKVFATNDYLTAADANDYFMEQAVIRCTSGTRPSSPNEGMLIHENDTDRYVKWNATTSAWEPIAGQRVTTFQPTLTSNGTNPTMGTGPVRNSWYAYGPGPTVTYAFHFAFGSSMSAGTGTYFMSLPVTAASVFATGNQAVGTLLIADASAGTFKQGAILIPSTNLGVVQGILESSTQLNSSTYVWAQSDYISGTITYAV